MSPIILTAVWLVDIDGSTGVEGDPGGVGGGGYGGGLVLGGIGGCVGCSGRDDVEGGALRGAWDTEGEGGVCRPGDSGTGGEGCV
eukprot:scaffold107036_cov48-Phaeocystis_antarctica.AAC.1